jgi:hypothetical protein
MADAAIAELGYVGLADDDRASLLHAFDGNIVFVRDKVLVGGRAARHANTRSGDEVLDPERHASERTRIAPCHHDALDCLGLLEREFRRGGTKCMHGRLERVHTRKRGLNHVDRGQLSGPDRMRDPDGIQVRQFVVCQNESSF